MDSLRSLRKDLTFKKLKIGEVKPIFYPKLSFHGENNSIYGSLFEFMHSLEPRLQPALFGVVVAEMGNIVTVPIGCSHLRSYTTTRFYSQY